jgi:hypothetical protein
MFGRGKKNKVQSVQDQETNASLHGSLDMIKDALAKQEKRYDEKDRESEIIAQRLSEAMEAYRSNQAAMSAFEEQRQLSEIARLQDKLDHVVDMKNRILGEITQFNVMERELEASLENQKAISVSQDLDPEHLQSMIEEIDARFRTQSVHFTPLVKPVANPLAGRLDGLKQSILGTAGPKQAHPVQTSATPEVQGTAHLPPRDEDDNQTAYN